MADEVHDRARVLRQRVEWMYYTKNMEALLSGVREVNEGLDDSDRRYGLEIHMKEFVGTTCRDIPLSLILPAFGGPSGEVDAGAQFFALPGDPKPEEAPKR